MFFAPFQNPDISSFGPLHRCDEERPMYMRRKKEKAAYVNYEKKAENGWEGKVERGRESSMGGIREKKRKMRRN
jgi:hypothetical protein